MLDTPIPDNFSGLEQDPTDGRSGHLASHLNIRSDQYEHSNAGKW